jgi:hypothetical protein
MANEQSAPEDRYLAPGTRVRRDALVNDNDYATSEYGIVVHCWLDDEIGMFNCYVAFFGEAFPAGKPAHKPYILRYAAVGMTELVGEASSSGGS